MGKCGEKGAGRAARAGVGPVLAWETGVGQGGSPGDGDPFRIPEGETNTGAVGPGGGGELEEPQNEKKKEGKRRGCLERHGLRLQVTDSVSGFT